MKTFRVCMPAVLLIAAIAGASSTAWSAEIKKLPHRDRFETKYEDKQYAYSNVLIEGSGQVNVDTKFSNGKEIDGDTFVAVTLFLGSDSEVIAAMRQTKGLPAAFRGKTQEGVVESKGVIPRERLSELNRVEVHYGRKDKFGDVKIWKAIETLIQVLMATEGQEFKVFAKGTKLG